ncbi:50S ribosomal protein L18 [Patescibacteria group bacterium]|nr:50S ribosomal protein L18 [Patescibacteria group bacterium]
MKSRDKRRIHRHKRVRAKVYGTKEVPRLSVYKSLNHLYVQIINDDKQQTLLGLSDTVLKEESLKKSEKAAKLGEEIAKKAKEKKITSVVFDRGGYAYLGRVKALADGARKGGLQF